MESYPAIIGVTGSFGSGCSTLCKGLKDLGKEHDLKVKGFRISDEIREEAANRGIEDPDRPTMQNIGNELRRENGNEYWAGRISSKIAADQDKHDIYLVDGIRNLGEVQEFRKYRNFFLVVVDCSTENRWERLKNRVYKGDKIAFERDDRRDRDERLMYGQQVLRCVEEADVIFINEEKFPTELRVQDDIKNRFNDNLMLITGQQLRRPNVPETMMAAASNLALQSRCVKRRVGAVLCSKEGFVVSAAYNAVPYPGKSCYEEYRMCYRDVYRNELRKQMVSSFAYCPNCGEKLENDSKSEDFRCSTCKVELSNFFPPVRALDKCRALHAEETVILRTPQFQINGSTLYTTTFPCLQCAKRIIQARLKAIIYIDPYPENEAIKLLEQCGVHTEKFGGVKAQAFYRFFYPYREWLEKQIQERLEEQVYTRRQ